MQGPHDVGGRRGFGPIRHTPAESVFHQHWEGHGFVLGLLSGLLSGTNTDAFRHSMERLDARDYLGLSYYGRWTHACATLLTEAGVIDRAELDARVAHAGARPFPTPAPNPPHHRPPRPATEAGITRTVERPRRFAEGDPVVVRCDDPPGHTRVPGYLRGRRGRVLTCRPGGVWPDASAHGHGEDPQWLYAVRFVGVDLWGADAQPGTSVTVDLFEPHLEPEEPR